MRLGHAVRLFTDEVFAVFFHARRSDCLVLKASCCDSTAVARKSCQVQRSDESAALGRALLFKCSKTAYWILLEHHKSIIK